MTHFPSGRTAYLTLALRRHLRSAIPALKNYVEARGKGEFVANLETELRSCGEHQLANQMLEAVRSYCEVE